MYYLNKRLATILIFAETVTLGQQAFSQSSIPANKVKDLIRIFFKGKNNRF